MEARHTDDGRIEVARILVLVQGAIGVVSTIEALVVGAASGFLTAPVVLLTAAVAALTLWAAAGLGRRSRRARRTIIIVEVVVVLAATVDLLLSLFLAQRMLELVPLLTRFVLPIAVVRLLRRPAVRGVFGVKQSRRTRRRERAAAAAALEAAPV